MQNLNNNIMFILLPVNVIVPRTLLNGNRQLINHQTHLSVLHYFAYPLVAQYASSDRDFLFCEGGIYSTHVHTLVGTKLTFYIGKMS